MTSHSRTFWVGAASILFVVALAAVLPYGDIAAQPARTPRGQGRGESGGVAATLEAQSQAVEMTANALSNRGDDLAATADLLQGIGATVDAQGASAMATAQAGLDTVLVQATRIAATAQYLATTVNQSSESIQSTVTALSADLTSLSTELDALLTYFAELGSISYDNGVMTATMFVSEAQANLLLDILVEAAGYDPASVSMNTTSEGTIEVILVDVSTEFSGTLVMTYRLDAVNGSVTIELVSVTLNGQTVPLAMLPDDLVSAVELAVNAAAVQPMLSVPEVGYSIETLNVTDDGILLSVMVAIE